MFDVGFKCSYNNYIKAKDLAVNFVSFFFKFYLTDKIIIVTYVIINQSNELIL